jgi:hypothetical protein
MLPVYRSIEFSCSLYLSVIGISSSSSFTFKDSLSIISYNILWIYSSLGLTKISGKSSCAARAGTGTIYFLLILFATVLKTDCSSLREYSLPIFILKRTSGMSIITVLIPN